MKAPITCPNCHYCAVEDIPSESCLFFYRCLGCNEILRPKPGDCCVFCSYSDRHCPSRDHATTVTRLLDAVSELRERENRLKVHIALASDEVRIDVLADLMEIQERMERLRQEVLRHSRRHH